MQEEVIETERKEWLENKTKQNKSGMIFISIPAFYSHPRKGHRSNTAV